MAEKGLVTEEKGDSLVVKMKRSLCKMQGLRCGFK